MRRAWLLLLAASLGASPASTGSEPAAATATLASLRIEAGDGEYLAWADNRLAGPIEVLLTGNTGRDARSDPPLPARATVGAGDSALVARLQVPAIGIGALHLSLRGVPGHPGARPRDVAYLPPVPPDSLRIEQGWGGSASHDDDENRHALDFAADPGTPVLAARGGTVMQVEAGFRGSGLDRARLLDRANVVRILHDDGTMALYAHLAPDGARVRPGQQVLAGEQIAVSGNTGYSSGPHLHFVVQVNRGLRLVSVPFRMPGVLPPDRGVAVRTLLRHDAASLKDAGCRHRARKGTGAPGDRGPGTVPRARPARAARLRAWLPHAFPR